MAVNIPKLGSSKVYNYHYDQLNRIVAMDLFNGLNVNAGTFTAGISTDYQERTSYDPNGNILTYLRNGDGNRLSMDNLSYFYKSGTNQLHKVTDGAADASVNDYSKYNDLRQGQLDSNYRYDAIGNLTSDAKDTITSITWNVYGKIQSITKNGQVIRYIYDAAGNRIFKYTPNDTTAYVRDASGNVLSVYTRPAGQSPLVQSETHLYGSSRLGIATRHLAADTTIVLSGGFGLGQNSIFTRGEKLFELSNHLGNVLATIADRRIPVDANSDGIIESYKADLVSAQDYYPFGMQMPGRKYSNDLYRYGFNGKENDNEVKGEGNQQDYGMRISDPRVGRFLSVDPLSKKFPYYTPYQYAGNKPIWCVDLDGLEDLPSTAINKYGEKQVYEITTTTEYGSAGPLSIDVQKSIPQYAQPATKGMTDIQVYQFAFTRFAEPGRHLIKSNQYIDERLMKAEQQVDYFFSHQVPAYSKSTVATRIAHTAVAFGLAQGDQSTVAQIQKSDDFLYRNDLASIIVGVTPIGAGMEIRNALAAFTKIETRSLGLLAKGFKANWATGDLQSAITKFVGKDASFELAESGKIIWKSESSSMQVIQDPLNKYFRILDTKAAGKRSYTNLDGGIPNNKVINGKTSGNSQAEYNQLTHFNY